ncbi:MAG: filamentous hemagglutinin N-terminal domain-containing protein [Verrucomicrobiota bacterium]
MKTPVSFLLIVALVLTPLSPLTSNPIDPEVIAGAVEFTDEFSDLLEITQSSDKAIIHWEGFSIDSGEITRFIQPGSSAAVLNRVVSGDTSQIEGVLEANGRVLLINPNGILFGAGARVDTNGFVASTLNVPDAEFLAGGDMRFSGASQAPVANLGEITAANGDIFLVGATVQNDGNLNAPNGAVGLAAGQQVLITKEGDERVFVEVGSNGSVDHSGAIRAAQAELKAAGGNPKAMAVNVSGSVEATGVERRGGRVYLSAGGGGVRVASHLKSPRIQVNGAEVQIDAEGNLDASGESGGEIQVVADDGIRVIGGRLAARSNDSTGGAVEIAADSIGMETGTRVSADGAIGGGLVQLNSQNLNVAEGTEVRSSASVDGDGGVVLASAATAANIGGSLAARGKGLGSGGFVHVSGGDLTLTQTSRLDATGAVDGGLVTVDGSGNVQADGRIDAKGQSGDGGFINLTGDAEVNFGATARLDAGGEVGGGMVTVGGGGDVIVAPHKTHPPPKNPPP